MIIFLNIGLDRVVYIGIRKDWMHRTVSGT